MEKLTYLKHFLTTYFKVHGCKILHNEDGLLSVQLTEALDRELMNRPFYWHYMKSIGQQGEPMTLSLIINPKLKHKEGEWIHFGSPRLQQIINHLRRKEKYIKLYQNVETTIQQALYPWLLINIKVTYKGRQTKDEIFSVGLNLINGVMKVDMMNVLSDLTLSKTISDYCYLMSPIIKLKSGYKRIEKVIDHYIQNQNHSWAEESLKFMDEDIQMVEHFYQAKNETKQKRKEIHEIKERYQPQIIYEVINGGIVYLTKDFNHQA